MMQTKSVTVIFLVATLLTGCEDDATRQARKGGATTVEQVAPSTPQTPKRNHRNAVASAPEEQPTEPAPADQTLQPLETPAPQPSGALPPDTAPVQPVKRAAPRRPLKPVPDLSYIAAMTPQEQYLEVGNHFRELFTDLAESFVKAHDEESFQFVLQQMDRATIYIEKIGERMVAAPAMTGVGDKEIARNRAVKERAMTDIKESLVLYAKARLASKDFLEARPEFTQKMEIFTEAGKKVLAPLDAPLPQSQMASRPSPPLIDLNTANANLSIEDRYREFGRIVNGLFDELAAGLEKVTDEASLRQFNTEFDAILGRLHNATEKIGPLPALAGVSKEEAASNREILEKLRADLKDSATRFANAAIKAKPLIDRNAVYIQNVYRMQAILARVVPKR